MSKIIVTYTPNDKAIFREALVVRFADDTQHQVEPFIEALAEGTTALVCDTAAPEPMEPFRRFPSQMLTDLHNALRRRDEPMVGLPRIREDGIRRLHDRIVLRAREAEPQVWNAQPTVTDQGEHQRQMVEHADLFVVCAFRGHPKGYDRTEAKTLDEARSKAVSLHQDRPVGIYAVRGNRQVHVENYPPTADFHANPLQREELEMAREAKLGEFKPVGKETTLGKVLEAYLEFEDLTVADLAHQSGLDEAKVLNTLRNARGANGIGFTVDAETKVVKLQLPVPDDQLFRPAKEPKVAESKEPRQLKVGEFRQVRRGTGTGKLVEAAMAGGTYEAIAAALGLNADAVKSDLSSLRRTHGMDHSVAEDGSVTLNVPDGKDPFVAAAAPREPRAAGAPRSPRQVGAFKPVRAGTSLARIVESAGKGGRKLADIAAEAGIREDQASHRLRHVLGVNHGVDYTRDAEGVITLVPPAGKTLADVIASPAMAAAAE